MELVGLTLSLSAQRLVALGDHVVRRCSTCSRTSAALAILPIFQGQRLTLRSALNVVFSSELTRSPMARMPLWTLL